MSITNIYIGFKCFLKYWWDLNIFYYCFSIFPRCFEKILNLQKSWENGILSTISFTYIYQLLTFCYICALKYASMCLFCWTICKWIANITYFPLKFCNMINHQEYDILLYNHNAIITHRTFNINTHYLNPNRYS